MSQRPPIAKSLRRYATPAGVPGGTAAADPRRMLEPAVHERGHECTNCAQVIRGWQPSLVRATQVSPGYDAEFVTAIALVAGSVGLLTGQSWSQWLYLVAIGMLFYTVIVSPGYYAEKDEWPIVAMFAVILVLALASLVLII
ncbi:MAG: hypothetical protein U9R25_11805 [Chloroflexota bacterium]|nr:hypothetical protein [Chloroflexota bacterium]